MEKQFDLCYQSKIDIDLVLQEVRAMLSGREFCEGQLNELVIQTIHEVEMYCNRLLDETYVSLIAQIVVIKVNRLGSEGLASMSMSGVSESYINDYPENIRMILKSKRKAKFL